jgi:hypothetical protein
MKVNEHPLRIVEHRAGEGVAAPEPAFIACSLVQPHRLVSASVHRKGCGRAPVSGTRRSDGAHWEVRDIKRGDIGKFIDIAAFTGVETAVWCTSCGGWRVSQ